MNMNEEEFEDKLIKYSNTSGHKKFRNYTREIFESEYFQRFVKKIRKNYKIPTDGFKPKAGRYIFPPENWALRNDKKMRDAFNAELKKLSQKYKIHFLDGLGIFENYIFYNDTDYVIDFGGYGMCMTIDVPQEKKEPFSKDIQEDDDMLYPVAIRISPYASLRDILDYIKAYSDPISRIQNKYKEEKIKFGKFKEKKTEVQERNELIYKNRHLPRKEIMRLITDKFGSKASIDYAYIGKIISTETKKRKEL